MAFASRSHMHGNMTRPLARGRADGHFHILAQNGEKFHQAADRYGFQSHEGRHLRLGGAQELCGGGLREIAGLEQAMDLQGELCLEQFLPGIGEAQIGEDVAFAFFNGLAYDFVYVFLYKTATQNCYCTL